VSFDLELEGVELTGQEEQIVPSNLTDLKRGMELEGTITKIGLYGALVDVGLEREGLIHLSRMKRGQVNRTEEVLELGQSVQTWVHRVDPDKRKLELTLIRPLALPWRKIRRGLKVNGKVVRVEKFGAFVEIGAERPGLVHVSELSDGYIPDPNDIVSEGDDVVVSIIEFNRRKKQINLSMKGLYRTEPAEDEEPKEEPPTAMEVALKEALEKAEKPGEKALFRGESSSDQKTREAQDDLLQRTLEQRMNTSA
jgi:ribosomal protein S1